MSRTYTEESFIRGIITDEDDLARVVNDYAAKNLLSSEITSRVIMQLMTNNHVSSMFSGDDGRENELSANQLVEAVRAVGMPTVQLFSGEFSEVINMELTSEQRTIIDTVTA
jgi:hypothetical protein